MNKLFGFYELRRLGVPTVPWQEFREGVLLEPGRLWTVRMALREGPDWNLPRLVGACARRAEAFARELLARYGPSALVVYYPYFVAVTSGTLLLERQRTVVEAVRGDLWNLTTRGRAELTLAWSEPQQPGDPRRLQGDDALLGPQERAELQRWARRVRAQSREFLEGGHGLLLEWSVARDAAPDGQPQGPEYLVFYEWRAVPEKPGG